jgi:hypothetical protein
MSQKKQEGLMSWIKVCDNTPDKSEVWAIAKALNIHRLMAFGALVKVWLWADKELTSGKNHIIAELELIDDLTNIKGLAGAMLKVGWLLQVEGGFTFPNIDRHISETAKARALAANRKARSRVEKPVTLMSRSQRDKVTAVGHANVTLMSRSQRDKSVTREEKRREEKIREEKKEEESGSAPPTATAENDKPILRFPIQGANGMDSKRDWHLSRDQVDRFRELFPTVDVLAECRKALAWVEADPKRRKTAGGYPRYLTGWLNRTAETKAGPGQVAQAVGPNGKPLTEIERLSMEMFGEVF